ncbi:MAG: DNA repair protein RecN [candidate division FCPU426 bacterium]
MMLELSVRNISLIPALTLEPGKGLVVLTGETGAGKSILLGALSLLLGERASSDVIRAGSETATVEALFAVEGLPQVAEILEAQGLPPCEDQTLILKRVLARNGKSKCYVNGGFTTLSVLERLGAELVDLHGQHEHQSLLERSRQRDLLDAWAGLMELRRELGTAYAALKASREARERLALDEAERTRRLDLLNYQVQEIDAAAVKPGENAVLQEERERLAHAERLLGTVHEVLDILHRREENAARDGLAHSANALAQVAAYDPQLGALADELRSAEAIAGEVVSQLSKFADSFEADPERLNQVEERLDLLQKLGRKYGPGEEAILAYRDQAAREQNQLAHRDEELARLAESEAGLAANLSQLARRLSDQRRAASEKYSREVKRELDGLGFIRPEFIIAVSLREDPEGWVQWEGKTYACGPAGADELEFLIAPNPGEEPKPVAKIASGGELSRLMLALKVAAAAAAQVPTMIFDEVDAGIGGATAEAVGRKLAALAKNRQVVVITHLPQIARFANRHFLVAKRVEQGRTVSSVEALSGETRIREVARLMAGEQITETALQHARELIEKP